MLPAKTSSLAQTPIPGGWMEDRIVIGGHAFDLLRPSQPEAFLELLEERDGADAEQDPYWGELWPTSNLMATFVLGETWPPGTPALELGCGLGLVGLAGLKAGLDVTFSDLHDSAVRTAVENAGRNGFRSVLGRVLDWRHPTDGSWPLILASDVLYERQLHSPLLDTLDALLSPDGVCWIGDPLRSSADSFIDGATSRGYRVKILTPEPADARFRLLRLTGNASAAEQDSNRTIE